VIVNEDGAHRFFRPNKNLTKDAENEVRKFLS
jgi:hypothetical protein